MSGGVLSCHHAGYHPGCCISQGPELYWIDFTTLPYQLVMIQKYIVTSKNI